MSTTNSKYIEDFATGKQVLKTPEEEVRQEYEHILVESYGYYKTDIDIEVRIPRGTGYFPDKADIAVYSGDGRDPTKDIVGIVEAKRPDRTDGIEQLKSYMTATSAIWGVWTNGTDIAYVCRQGTKVLEDHIHNIPVRGQSLEDIGRLTKDSLKPFGRSELKVIFRRILFTLYGNGNISRRDRLGGEMIKIIFSKLQDEKTYLDRPPEFRAEVGEAPRKIASRVKKLFRDVLDELKGDDIFKQQDKIVLDDPSIAWVVGQLERGSLLKTDTDVVGDAFEVFSEPQFVGEKGEFFTPRGVVHIAVKLADPNPNQIICDPACGSGGFLVTVMRHIWGKMEKDPKWRGTPELKESKRRMAEQFLFGIDKEVDLVRIAKAHMAIAGDGRSNICHQNSLHTTSQFKGDALKHFVSGDNFEQFDIILTNPPFSTKTKISARDAANFELGYTWKLDEQLGKWIKGNTPGNRDPYVLFIERCLDMLKVRGTLCIVLPETVFHGPSKEHLRHFFLHGNNLIAVIDLPHNTFRPYCNAKTCLLVLQKGVPQQERIIMAMPEEMGHDPLYRYGTDELWDDLAEVLEELDRPEDEENKHVFSVSSSEFDPDILMPKFYRGIQKLPNIPKDRASVSLEELLDDGIIEAWDGHGSPPAHEKGMGEIPYIRVSDIVNWEMYRNPVTGIPEDVYLKKLGKKRTPKEGDVIFVRRGSYRIGTVAMVSPRDERVLLTTELVTLRVTNMPNKYGITPFYLLFLLSSELVQNQLDHCVFVDTTLPTIGKRWKKLILPIHTDLQEIERISKQVENVMRHKWAAQEQTDILRNQMGKIVT
ncbi:MAG: N-6 DNA methylase [Candidatus Poribacteria bacterium]|nr:N-6 DNA methylase [Candidatus Poribacteria bacterium]